MLYPLLVLLLILKGVIPSFGEIEVADNEELYHFHRRNRSTQNTTEHTSRNDWRESFQRQVVQNSNDNDGVVDDDDGVFRIAVHIRRGDVNPCHYAHRYLPNQHYLDLIQQKCLLPTATKTGGGRRVVRVTIYSESESYESWEDFRKSNYTVLLDTPLIGVWKALITADCAVLSRSSFSYSPALLNKNPRNVMYTQYKLGPIPGWTVVLPPNNTEKDALRKEACRIIPPRRGIGIWLQAQATAFYHWANGQKPKAKKKKK